MGIVGMGRIGRGVAERARGFRMPILYHNRARLSPDLERGARYFAAWMTCCRTARCSASTCQAGRAY